MCVPRPEPSEWHLNIARYMAVLLTSSDYLLCGWFGIVFSEASQAPQEPPKDEPPKDEPDEEDLKEDLSSLILVLHSAPEEHHEEEEEEVLGSFIQW